jgi:UDP-3-O-acyl N-acetylglucosamine deacetylase
MTVEHVLATLNGLGITNIVIEVIGSEMPAMDGSSLPYVNFLKSLGVVEQKKKKKTFTVTEPIFIGEKTKALAAFPSEDFRVSYVLDYPMPSLAGQSVDFTVTEEVFEKQIAPARTFCTDVEAQVLRDQGFGLGATPDNTVLMSSKGPIGAVLRFPDECARHKALDMIGDLMLTGLSLKARFIGIRSGHALNSLMVDKILRLAEEAS